MGTCALLMDSETFHFCASNQFQPLSSSPRCSEETLDSLTFLGVVEMRGRMSRFGRGVGWGGGTVSSIGPAVGTTEGTFLSLQTDPRPAGGGMARPSCGLAPGRVL